MIEGYQAGKVHYGNVKMNTGGGLHDDCALVLLALNHSGCSWFCLFLLRCLRAFGISIAAFAVFTVHKVAYPSADALSAHVFHGHAADSG